MLISPATQNRQLEFRSYRWVHRTRLDNAEEDEETKGD